MNTDNRYHWPHKDLLDVTQLSRADTLHLLDLAASFQEINSRPVKKVPTLKGKTVVLFFVENSTRASAFRQTRLRWARAAQASTRAKASRIRP